MQLKFAEIDAAVSLSIGRIDDAAGREFSGRCMLGRAQDQVRGDDGDGAHIAIRPSGHCRAVDEGVETEAAILRRGNDRENRVERDVFEIGYYFAVEQDWNERSVDKDVAGGSRLFGARSDDLRREDLV